MNYYLPEGCARPDEAALQAFYGEARAAMPEAGLSADFDVRWIGLDADTTEAIIGLIAGGDKTGTYTLPWIVAASGAPAPAAGLPIVLIDMQGRPRLLLRLTRVETVSFAGINETHTALDGTPVRDLAIWRPMHTQYWNALLAPFGREVSEDMPVLVEAFEVLYPG